MTCVLQHAGDLARAACVVLALFSAGLVRAQEIAITIDDLPYVMASRTSPAEGLGIARAVIDALATHDIKAVGFAIGNQITPQTRPVIAAFAEAGHKIGNHSWSHPDYGTLSKRAFRRETRRTDRALAEWMTDPKFYRFPYLREGETEAAKQAADTVLRQFGYRNVPVTIDNDEWRFNADYMDALEAGDTRAAAQIASDYIAHMQERTVFFQALADKAVGRDVAHILLLHMNKINADHLGTLLDWYAASGWTFVSVQDALEDPFYALPDLYAGPRGLSQIERVMGRKAD
ncbi:MAG: polysaccharide deacetylase family protein [Pseudomonadota bacterium]